MRHCSQGSASLRGALATKQSSLSLRQLQFWIASLSLVMTTPSRRRVRFHQFVNHRIHQGLERGVNDIGRYANGGPALSGLVFAFDQDSRDRLGAAIEDAHAI